MAVATAAQNARNHFALAAAAPALENIGLITTLVLAAKIFGSDTHHVSTAYLLFLGVGRHAGGRRALLRCSASARRAPGCRCGRRGSWTDPAVHAFYRRIVPAIGTASLDAGWLFVLIVAAGTVPGGVVAIQIGINFYYLPVALSAKAVGTVSDAAALPRSTSEKRSSLSARLTTVESRGPGSSRFRHRSRCCCSASRSRSRLRSAR